MSQTEHFYQVDLSWLAGKEGQLSSGTLPPIMASSPPEFNGKDGIWTPEHLFLASINSCFMLTFLAIAEISKLEFISFNCQANGKLERPAGAKTFEFTEVTLTPKVVLKNIEDKTKTEKILEKSERNCFISNSIKCAIKLIAEISTGS